MTVVFCYSLACAVNKLDSHGSWFLLRIILVSLLHVCFQTYKLHVYRYTRDVCTLQTALQIYMHEHSAYRCSTLEGRIYFGL